MIRLDPKNVDAPYGLVWYRQQEIDFANTKEIVDFGNRDQLGSGGTDRGLHGFEEMKTTFDSGGPGAIELLNGKYDAAINECNATIWSDPGNALVYLIRAKAWRATGEYTNALADLKNVTRQDPQNDSAFDLTAQIRAACPDERLHDGKEAVESATRACDLTSWKKAIISTRSPRLMPRRETSTRP